MNLDYDDNVDIWKAAPAFLGLSIIWGLFYSFLSLFISFFQWLGQLVGWSENDLSWIQLFFNQLRFGWTSALFLAIVIISYVVLFGTVWLAFRVIDWITKKRMAYFTEKYPEIYRDLTDSVGSLTMNLGVWWISSVITWICAFIAYLFGIRSTTWIVVGSVTLVLSIFYASMLYKVKNLGLWAFYHVRSFILPYIFIAGPIFVGFSFVSIFQYQILSGYYKFLGTDLNSLGYDTGLEFEWEPIHLLWAISTVLAVLLLVIWFLPILIKKDYMKLGAITLAISSPWLGNVLIQYSETTKQQLARLLEVVPIPLFSLLAALAVSWLFDNAKGFFVKTYKCPLCGKRSRPQVNYCSQCGAKKVEKAL